MPAYQKIASVANSLGNTGGTTSPAIDTTGADLIIYFSTFFDQFRGPNYSDNKGNSYTRLAVDVTLPTKAFECLICHNPTVGSGHTFTADNALGSIFNSLGVIAFKNSIVPFDQEGSASNSGLTSIQAGSLTPSTPNSLVLSMLITDGFNDNAVINSGYTKETSVPWVTGVSEGNFIAYKILTGAPTAQNPTWSWTNAMQAGVMNVIFSGTGNSGGAGKSSTKGHKGGGGISQITANGTANYNIGNPGITIGST